MLNKENTNHEYPICQDLKLEIKALEKVFIDLSIEKDECENLINSFNTRYLSCFGGLIEEILELRASLHKKRKTILYDFYKSIEEYHENIDYMELDESETKDLKEAYRKACRLCHPDKLDEKEKNKGTEIFKALNDAYRNRDLEKVSAILFDLEKETNYLISNYEKINDRSGLQKKISELQNQIELLYEDIKQLKESEIFTRIQSINNINDYFYEVENELKSELKALQDKVKLY